ncbi:MFS transporter [Moraxella catarrhalis]|uniref:MFS transporter n=1 Tax=Moraxella catarrhalis TaxID=480 RepID=UPI00128CC349|nr:MFS transporter [Moraxella catarrhalis]MPW46713.1 MFS transporter [Moraxella catarrhalis]MPW47997.1 MFS transporter [Moraxella catarrhalis]
MSAIIAIPKTLKTIIFYGVAFGSFRMLIGGISTLYLLSKNIDLIDLGLLKSFQFGLMMIIDLPLYYIADRYSRKLSTILGILFGSFWLLTTAFASEIWQFYVAEAFNAISLSLFGGAYISYLIDIKNKQYPDLDNKTLLSYDNKYNSLGMAICAFVGASFLEPASNIIWIIAGTLLFIVSMGAFLQLPSDIYQSTHNNISDLKINTPNFSENLGRLISILKTKQEICYGLIVLSILLIYFQTILQLWQPVIKNFNTGNLGWIYGMFFSIVSLAQLLSSYAINSNIKNKYTYILICLFLSLLLMLSAITLFQHSTKGVVLIVISLFIMFFGIKFLMIEASAKFHDIIPNNHRSLLDGMAFFISRTILLIIFPAITYLIQKMGFIALPLIFSILITLYMFIGHQFKTNINNNTSV